MNMYPNGTYATIEVVNGQSKEWPVVERLGNGWMSGAHYYPDSKVRSVRVLNVAPEPRTITTVEELDALPTYSTVRDLSGKWGALILQKAQDGQWYPCGAMIACDIASAGPFTLLWEPK